ncbi:MAG: C40 family peptidase, partial [Mogibacterium sp.]|nr:C40 family peptidase [Mogibacterium sp.]
MERDRSSRSLNGEDVIAYGRQFVGNPYVWGGNSLTNGCDCSGFIV